MCERQSGREKGECRYQEQRVGGKASEKTERGLSIELHWTMLPTLALEAKDRFMEVPDN